MSPCVHRYALVSSRSSRFFWAGMLLYAELLLLANYAALIPARLGCAILLAYPSRLDLLSYWGLHTSVGRLTPLFLAYLAILGHNYSLARWQAARNAWKSRTERQLKGLGMSVAEVDLGVTSVLRRLARSWSRSDPKRPRPPARAQFTLAELGRIMSAKAWRFLAGAFQGAERPPHFVILNARSDAFAPDFGLSCSPAPF